LFALRFFALGPQLFDGQALRLCVGLLPLLGCQPIGFCGFPFQPEAA
jgi:hypothetical protein